VMGYALVKSYSRGAWVGTAVGLAYLVLARKYHEIHEIHEIRGTAEYAEEEPPRTKEHGTPISAFSPVRVFRVFRGHALWLILAVSVAVIAFWAMQGVEGALGRRAVSVANANDFSWRNRVAAWEGALQMMSDRLWLGFGWNQPERIYDQFYRPSWLPEGGAFQLNNYMTLGTSVGVGALLCFLFYVGLALRRTEKSDATGDPRPISAFQRFSVSVFPPSSVCRAGALVLLVGFWFDGGLFKLALAAPFWMLLELGREDHETHEIHEKEPELAAKEHRVEQRREHD
jgi:O-antigen ligase